MGSPALTGPAPERLGLSAAGSGAGAWSGAWSGVGLPHCLKDRRDVRPRLELQSMSDYNS